MRSSKFKVQSSKFILIVFLLLANSVNAQLKFVVEDFEGFADGTSDLKANGVFTFGNIKAAVNSKVTDDKGYLGERVIELNKTGNLDYGGWGKGLSLNVELFPNQDYLNFFVSGSNSCIIKIELQEDDNGNGAFEKNLDDSWNFTLEHKNTVVSEKNKDNWELVSIPLHKFKDLNPGGDGDFNINYKQGKLISIIISFIDPSCYPGSGNTRNDAVWLFDFICFSKGKLPSGKELVDLPSASKNDFCGLGAWSKEGNTADFSAIAKTFESNFKCNKKLGVVHFFQPFAVDGGNTQNHYPSIERVNKVIEQGYLPMITLEDHFVNLPAGQAGASLSMKQPNLYSIVEGHLDPFFAAWAKEIKQVNGTVLLRILHEFNGNWYPWCIVNNDRNPDLFKKAFIHIHDLFTAQNVKNVKFIWCPNSMSLPQEKWNFIMDAYPGNEYVDYLGLDIYNGAGESRLWRSFRKEGIENYYLLTQQLDKPLFICEIASRERESNESKSAQNKAEWIKQMSEALTTDMSKIRLLTWFNEKSTFKVNSSIEAQNAFQKYIMLNDHFKSGIENIYPLVSD
ncbi:MAG: glycoside hydrolase family 26 protein [Bacteroidota bacterium]